jgi:hypothetical protein
MESLIKLYGYKLDIEKIEVEEGTTNIDLNNSLDSYNIDEKQFCLKVDQIDISYS